MVTLEVTPREAEMLAGDRLGEAQAAMHAWQSSVSGGLNVTSSLRSDVSSEQKMKGVVVLSSKALLRNYDSTVL